MLRFLITSVAALGLLVLAGLWIAARLVGPQSEPGVRNDRLAPCPASPNCVSSQADPTDTTHYVAPFAYIGSREATRARLLDVLRKLPRMHIVTSGSHYVRVEFRSRLFGFVDDAEFLFDDQARVVHLRSASRLGHGDFGVNRERVNQIRRRLDSAP